MLRKKDVFSILNKLRTDGAIGEYAVAGSERAWGGFIDTLPGAIDILMSRPSNPIQENPVPASVAWFAERVAESKSSRTNFDIAGTTVQFWPVTTALCAEAMERAIKHEIELKGFDALVRTRIVRQEHFVALMLEGIIPGGDFIIAQILEDEEVDLLPLKEVIGRHALTEKWCAFCVRGDIKDPLGFNGNDPIDASRKPANFMDQLDQYGREAGKSN
jgi:hypothetical protein